MKREVVDDGSNKKKQSINRNGNQRTAKGAFIEN
jgi:hypothetical protein